jgi:hypothetical protein
VRELVRELDRSGVEVRLGTAVEETTGLGRMVLQDVGVMMGVLVDGATVDGALLK